jgi:GT2 family glycosyltransferase
MVYVIVVTYNGMKWISKCLNSLSYDKIVSHIIIIDNLSTDGTPEFVQEHFPHIRLIKNNQNYGFGQSNNQGMKIACEEGAEYVFLLNQDAWIEDNTITKLVTVHRDNPQYGILSPIHLRGDGKSIDMKFGMFVTQSENHTLFSDLYLCRDKMAAIYPVPFINAAAWLIPVECLKIVGGFSPVYYHYGEDMDYANRVRFHDFKIGICPSTVIYHDRKNIVEYPNLNIPERYLFIKKNLHLIYLTDINHSFSERYLKSVFKIIIELFRLSARFHWKKALVCIKELGFLLRIYPSVLRNDAIAKKGNGAFLLCEANMDKDIKNECVKTI